MMNPNRHKYSTFITKPTYLLHQLKYINPNPTIPTMSAPYPGRQSPSPERQSGAQQQDTPGTGKTDVGKHPEPDFSQHSSEHFRDNVLTSNPEHPLEKIEAEKYIKGKQH
ncbi:hypothetical protein N7455_005446 [Penicillium solitum]|uniref:uncharacterized protein n=1 Tax=Penicillium solitum TaxID=60172 RepID=UPI0032C3D69B|nr:hypothetical protein N7455_005446 [Penicillium solitum]